MYRHQQCKLFIDCRRFTHPRVGCASFSTTIVGNDYSCLHDVIASGAEGSRRRDEGADKGPLVPFLATWEQRTRRTFR